jgi:hypothetical protein
MPQAAGVVLKLMPADKQTAPRSAAACFPRHHAKVGGIDREGPFATLLRVDASVITTTTNHQPPLPWPNIAW